jgi:hypothetical protein
MDGKVKATGRVAFETPASVWAEFVVGTPRLGFNICSIKIAVKRPAYGCLRCFALSAGPACPLCGGACEEILEEPNSALPKET